MNAIENYENIIKGIFNQDFNVSKNVDANNCIDALNSEHEYQIFKENYIVRLERIHNFFKDDSHAIENILKTLNSVAITKGYKWSGAYSELVALDYLIQCNELENIKYINKSNVNSFPNSVAKLIGQTEIDLDISFDLNWKTKVYMDVKSLIPTHLELVDQILEKVYKEITTNDYRIAIDDLFEVDYLETKKDYIYELKSGTLISRLKDCINQRDNYFEHILTQVATYGKNKKMLLQRKKAK
jgi:hypothetical protein